MFNAGGKINDARDVVVGSTNASLFAYVADGKNGLKVIQLTSPDSQPNFYGFSPEPKPELIAWDRRRIAGAGAVARASTATAPSTRPADQIAVFGRLGSRPFNLEEMERLFLKPDGTPWYVSDAVNDSDTRRSGTVQSAGSSGQSGESAVQPRP